MESKTVMIVPAQIGIPNKIFKAIAVPITSYTNILFLRV